MADRIIAIILITFNLVYLYFTLRLEKRGFSTGEIGPEVYPIVLSVCFFILSFLLLGRGTISRAKSAKKEFSTWNRELFRTLLSLGLMVGYIILLPQIGFLMSTPAFLILFIILYKVPKWWIAIATAGGTTLVIYVVFWKLFNTRLP